MPSTRQYSFFGNDGYGFPLGMGGAISQEESTANREARERRERREAAQAEQRAEEARQHAEQRDRWNREQREREQQARDRYRAHSWPGPVRHLRDTAQRLIRRDPHRMAQVS